MAIVKVTPALVERALGEVDWAAQDALSDDDIRAQILANPDAAPILSGSETASAIVLTVRAKLGLSQAEFAERYGIPMSTLQSWEARREPVHEAILSYLRVIATEPDLVARALHPSPKPALSERAAVM